MTASAGKLSSSQIRECLEKISIALDDGDVPLLTAFI